MNLAGKAGYSRNILPQHTSWLSFVAAITHQAEDPPAQDKGQAVHIRGASWNVDGQTLQWHLGPCNLHVTLVVLTLSKAGLTGGAALQHCRALRTQLLGRPLPVPRPCQEQSENKYTGIHGAGMLV
jgi:hypothetical protein